ncbi:MAG TPA: hypothetical protein VFZ08_09730, partial [Terriglobia bacterium]|nr:hypothetical protein [Terriglobia bacterium]
SSAIWLLVFVLIVTSVFGLYYYLRIIVTMYSGLPHAPEDEAHAAAPVRELTPASLLAPALSLGGGIALAVLTILLVWVGVYPSTLLQIIHTTVAGVL